METIFRKVSAKERLPNDADRTYMVIYTPAGLGLSQELIAAKRQKIEFLAKDFNCFDVWWFEGIELPTDEQIKTRADEHCESKFESDKLHWSTKVKLYEEKMSMAKWLMDFVLAVTPKEVKK